ncbi:MAG: hypothetical protein PHN82_12405, partial [bacterium]|nr:hypothetical protein [bacterium]
AVTWGGDGTLVKMYVDGVEQARKSTYTAHLKGASDPLYIGCAAHDGDPAWHFDGIIDEVEVLGREISAQEVRDKYMLTAGRWRFDEGSGCTAHDDSGNGRDGGLMPACEATPRNAPTWTGGIGGGALSFDGGDDHVRVDDPAGVFDLSRPFTLSLWANATSLADKGGRDGKMYGLLGKGKDAPGGGYSEFGNWNLYANQGWEGIEDRIMFTFDGDVVPDKGLVYSSTPMAEGEWYHIAVTWGGDGEKVKLYVNGALDGESLPYTADVQGSAHPVYIGCAAYDWGEPSWSFNGIIDEVKVFNRELSADKIWAEYQMYAPQ